MLAAALLLLLSGFFIGLTASPRYSVHCDRLCIKVDRWTGRTWLLEGEPNRWVEIR
jgi:hypothetical protein